ncbi:ATP-dependent helicase [Candidatus Woesebacteria bacterium]|nr:ATP-dependent helicase [Candidatus Woesebacteria bacterium]
MTDYKSSFATAYNNLNKEQKLAVDTIDGPLLVLAGPGTGKTQLLSARVANILKLTDIAPSNILCLTFTESGAANMRRRLREFIGEAAYEVTISTYHSFGSDIIKSHSEYFQQIGLDRTDDVRLERAIDELSQIRIVEAILGKLPFDSSLLSARYFVKDVVSTISDLKKNLITPQALYELGINNLHQIDSAQIVIDEVINQVGGISRKKDQWPSQYATLLERLSALSGSLVEQAAGGLKLAFDEYEESSTSTPLTKWKNAWLHKDDKDKFTLTKRATSEKMVDLSSIYESYEQALRVEASYDFNDMIIRAIEGLKNNDELRFNLQERYQYILLDEFQDTNPAQFELVKRIADHPVHEGRPNVMAVGDDDQAIFAFQGANIGNIQDFLESFREVQVINLVNNYRSHRDVLHVAQNIASQISGRLHTKLEGIDKLLVESSDALPPSSNIMRNDFVSEAAEYSWVARQIDELIKRGTKPSEVAVIAPKHKLLENMVPFLKQLGVPLTYEKRENILDTEIVKILHQSALLLDALWTNNRSKINEYFPQVLSQPYWGIPVVEVWRTNWQFAKKEEKRAWAEIALENNALSEAVNFYLTLSGAVATTPLESILDQLITETPLKSHYFAIEMRSVDAVKYYEAITHLSIIRSHLREYQNSSDHSLTLTDFLDFFAMYESAGEGLINSHPVAQGLSSVQLMTAYKAKGLEFDHVFILQAHDDVWGSASRGGGSKLSLPPNLSHIRYTHSGDDERLRLFFVAITRSRYGLYISSHSSHDNGKPTTPLKYLGEVDGVSPHLPLSSQNIVTTEHSSDDLARDVATLWSAGRVTLPVDFRDLLSEHLDSYVMSPTHLNTFMDLEHSGPEEFLMRTLLRFPSAPTPDSEYGLAIHNTLEWYQQQILSSKKPEMAEVLTHYSVELNHRFLSEHDKDHLLSRGSVVLQKYLTSRGDMFSQSAQTEVNFYSEGVCIGDARLTGKIDRLEIDQVNKTLRIVDFKTGQPLPKWESSMKAYKYKHQLYFYKFLIEGSYTWRSYKVTEARLEFVEPTDLRSGDIIAPLSIQFNEAEEQEIKKLIGVVWGKIQALDLPITDKYSKNLQGTKSFEIDLLA